jgi:hypothetical protein
MIRYNPKFFRKVYNTYISEMHQFHNHEYMQLAKNPERCNSFH